MIKYYYGDYKKSKNIIENESVDLFFLDPPYFISGKKIKNNSGMRGDWDVQWKTDDEYYEWVKEFMSLAYVQLKKTGTIYVCTVWRHSGKFQELLNAVGFYIQNRIVWKRDKGRGSNKNWKNNHEDIWFATKHKTNYTFNVNDVKVKKKVIAPYVDADGNPKDWFVDETGEKIRFTHPSNIWVDFTVPFWSMKEVRSYAKTKKSPNNVLPKHNTQKPKDLVKRCILASSNEDDLVVDYFAGSGTTGIGAKELKRNSILFDISEVSIKMIETRIKNELKINKFFD